MKAKPKKNPFLSSAKHSTQEQSGKQLRAIKMV
jgi:hypothetical protein